MTLYQLKLALADPPKAYEKKNLKIFGRCFLFVCTVCKRLHTQKISNSPSEIFFSYVKSIYFTEFTITITGTVQYS
jgi:hypothetical protein